MFEIVWNTTQSSQYQAECCPERRTYRNKKYADPPRRSAKPKKSKGLLDDGDTLLLLALLYILVREKCDNTLIFALLIAMLM